MKVESNIPTLVTLNTLLVANAAGNYFHVHTTAMAYLTSAAALPKKKAKNKWPQFKFAAKAIVDGATRSFIPAGVHNQLIHRIENMAALHGLLGEDFITDGIERVKTQLEIGIAQAKEQFPAFDLLLVDELLPEVRTLFGKKKSAAIAMYRVHCTFARVSVIPDTRIGNVHTTLKGFSSDIGVADQVWSVLALSSILAQTEVSTGTFNTGAILSATGTQPAIPGQPIATHLPKPADTGDDATTVAPDAAAKAAANGAGKTSAGDGASVPQQ